MATRTAFDAAGLPAMPMEDADAEVVLQRVLEGAEAGTRRTMELIFAQSPPLHRAQQVVAGLTGTSIEWRSTPEGPRAALRPDRERGDQARARITEPVLPRPGGARPPQPTVPTLRAGAGLKLSQDDTSSAAIAIQPGVRTWVETEHLAIDATRLSVEIGDVKDSRASTTWTLAMRTELRPDWDLVVDARGDTASPRPERVSLGPQWKVPVREAWSLGLSGATEPRTWPETPSWEVTIMLRSRSRWRLADALGQWPLGELPGATIESPMRVAAHGPNVLTPLVEAQIDRVLGTPLVVAGRPVESSCPSVP